MYVNSRKVKFQAIQRSNQDMVLTTRVQAAMQRLFKNVTSITGLAFGDRICATHALNILTSFYCVNSRGNNTGGRT